MSAMKIWLAALLCLGCAAPAAAQEIGKIGAGVTLGNPTGLTAKYHRNALLAFDLGLGFSGDFAVYGDALWHVWDLLPQPAQGKLGLYGGFGPRVETENDPEFGIRAIAGAAYWLPRHPIEVFIELGPVFQFAPDRRVQFDGGVGMRVYFAARKKG